MSFFIDCETIIHCIGLYLEYNRIDKTEYNLIYNSMKHRLTIIILLVTSFVSFVDASIPIAKIPFELEGNHIFINLSIQGSEELKFVFDTGAGGTVINSSTTKRLNLVSDRTTENSGASGTVTSEIIENVEININDIQLSKVNLQSVSLSHLEEVIGRNIDGIIGYHLLRQYVIEINYNTSELIVYQSKKYKYQGNGELIKIDLGYVPTAVFTVALTNDSYQNEEFIIDNGAGLAIAFTTPFSERNDLKNTIGKTYSNRASGFSKNKADVDVGRINKVKILGTEFTNIPVSIYNTNVGVFAHPTIAGVIGNEILKRFNITFDYKRKISYWEPNHLFDGTAFEISHSGLKLKLSSDKSKTIVDSIISETDISKSDIKAGDEIIEIDGIKAVDASLEQLRALLYQDGKKVEIKYLQDNQEKSLEILLRPLI